MSFAIDTPEGVAIWKERFQFPFRRDELCNRGPMGDGYSCFVMEFQFPFRRDELCNTSEPGMGLRLMG